MKRIMKPWLVGGVLAASLVLNGFLLGMVLSGPPQGPRPPFEDRMADLPPEARSLMQSRREALDAQKSALHEARAEVRRQLEADPLDPAALEQALVELRRRSNGFQAEMHRMIADAAALLPADQRSRLLPPRRPHHARGAEPPHRKD